MHPLVYIEPLVAILIIGNGVMIGFQTVPWRGLGGKKTVSALELEGFMEWDFTGLAWHG